MGAEAVGTRAVAVQQGLGDDVAAAQEVGEAVAAVAGGGGRSVDGVAVGIGAGQRQGDTGKGRTVLGHIAGQYAGGLAKIVAGPDRARGIRTQVSHDLVLDCRGTALATHRVQPLTVTRRLALLDNISTRQQVAEAVIAIGIRRHRCNHVAIGIVRCRTVVVLQGDNNPFQQGVSAI